MSVQPTESGAGVTTQREQRKQERHDQLVATARHLFAEKGVENTTIKDIAEAAGVAQGLLYHYFDSKEELLWAIVERYNPLPEMRAIFAGAEGRPVRDVLLQAATTAYALVSERQDIIRILLREGLTRPDFQERFRTLQQMAIAVGSGFLQRQIASGELRPHNTQASVRTFAGSIIAIYLSGASPDLIPDVIDNLLGGVAAPT